MEATLILQLEIGIDHYRALNVSMLFFFLLKFLNLFNFCVDRDIRQLFENLSLFPELRTRSLYVKPQECQ